MTKAIIDQNPHRQWLEGERISKKPAEMTSEELVKFTSAGAVIIIQRIKTLRPYFLELRKRFHNLDYGERICGYRNWGEYCAKHLKRTKRGLNYMLSGGNKNRPQLTAPRESLSGDQTIGKRSKAWEDVETVLVILSKAEQLLGLPSTEVIAKELQGIIRSAIQLLTETMTKLGVDRDT